MRVTLAGFNLDAELIVLLRQIIDAHRQKADAAHITDLLDRLAEEPLTPETISAAYARISRSEKGVRELRRDARGSVSRARQSNERIVFGLGHASVAEHAVFNLDITDASRLALEELESHRLVSYTEASQRYIAMSSDVVQPDEIVATGLGERFRQVCGRLFDGYRELSASLELFHRDLPERERLERAREDARYLLPLACRGQVGMTVNARNAEHIIQQSAHSQLEETRELGRQLHAALRGLTPSLIKYTDSNPLWSESVSAIADAFASTDQERSNADEEVTLLAAPDGGEKLATTALGLHRDRLSLKEAMATTERMGMEGRLTLLKRAHCHIDEHTPLRRELELGVFVFGLTLSASAFAQLKRHRIATLISQPYDPSLGVTVPPAVKAAGLEPTFRDYIAEVDSLNVQLQAELPAAARCAAQYALSNAHRRRVIFQVNARELTHFSRLREDSHAQWDIRSLAHKMVARAREASPALLFFAAGKDEFENLRNRMEQGGKATPPRLRGG